MNILAKSVNDMIGLICANNMKSINVCAINDVMKLAFCFGHPDGWALFGVCTAATPDFSQFIFML